MKSRRRRLNGRLEQPRPARFSVQDGDGWQAKI